MEFFYSEKDIDIDINKDTISHHKIKILPVNKEKLTDGLIDHKQIYISTLGCVHGIQSLLDQHKMDIEVRCFTEETKTMICNLERFPIFISNFNVTSLESGKEKIKSTNFIPLQERIKPLLDKNQKHIKIALINGIGTGIGDSIIGVRALQIMYNILSQFFTNVEIHLFQTPFNSNKNKHRIYDQEKIITSVQMLPITLDKLLEFDCVGDFSSMTLRDTFDILPMIDFFLANLGVDYTLINDQEKRNFVKIDESVANTDHIKFLALRHSNKPLLMLHSIASVAIRSMPPKIIQRLVSKLLQFTEYEILITNKLNIEIPKFKQSFSEKEQTRIHDFTHADENIDVFINTIRNVDAIITVDTCVYHIADSFNKPCVVFFPTIDPELRIKYYKTIQPIILKENNKLWGYHQSILDDDRKYAWSLWDDLNVNDVIKHLRSIVEEVKAETKFIKCPVCEKRNEYIVTDKFLSYDLVTCIHCSSEFCTPRIPDNYDHMYHNDYSHYINEERSRNEVVYGYMHQNRFDQVRPYLENLSTRGNLLDVGCANGFVVGYAKDLGFNAWGIDTSKEAIDFAKQKLDLHNQVSVCSDLKSLPLNFPKKYDVITSFELLEHLEDPNTFAEEVYNRLNLNGVWIFSTPNRNRIQFAMGIKNTGKHSGLNSGDYPAEHLTRFKGKSHKILCDRNGFDVFYQTTSKLFSDNIIDRYGLFPEICIKEPKSGNYVTPDPMILNRNILNYFQKMTNHVDGYGNFLITFARKR